MGAPTTVEVNINRPEPPISPKEEPKPAPAPEVVRLKQSEKTPKPAPTAPLQWECQDLMESWMEQYGKTKGKGKGKATVTKLLVTAPPQELGDLTDSDDPGDGEDPKPAPTTSAIAGCTRSHRQQQQAATNTDNTAQMPLIWRRGVGP